jgi:hypothetical protein
LHISPICIFQLFLHCRGVWMEGVWMRSRFNQLTFVMINGPGKFRKAERFYVWFLDSKYYWLQIKLPFSDSFQLSWWYI